MLRKNLPLSRLWWVMLVRFFMDYLAALQMLLTKQFPNAKAVFEARCAYHKLKKQYPRQRFITSQGVRNLSPRSIVFDFYVRRKRR
jgi:hypothetical protein